MISFRQTFSTWFLVASVLLSAETTARAQAASTLQSAPGAPLQSTQNAGGVLRLNLVVSGGSAGDLKTSDLTLLDNGSPASGQALQANGSRVPSRVILVIDDVNARLTTIAYERDQIKKYLLKNEGHLTVPITIAVMTDRTTEIQPGFSQDGAAENEALQKYKIGLHEITRSSQYGGLDRTNIGIGALDQLVQYASTLPGHKLILFVSPGWPLLAGPRIQLAAKEEDSIYRTVARLQDSMLRADITLDMLNPFGPTESPLRADYYEAFLKGVSRPADADLADLSLQVLATHSGGVVQQGTSDITGMMERSIADLDHRFTLSFAPGEGEKPNAYHSLKLQVNRPGVSVRMPDEYYAPVSAAGQTEH